MKGYDQGWFLVDGPANQKYIQYLDHEVATQAFPAFGIRQTSASLLPPNRD